MTWRCNHYLQLSWHVILRSARSAAGRIILQSWQTTFNVIVLTAFSPCNSSRPASLMLSTYFTDMPVSYARSRKGRMWRVLLNCTFWKNNTIASVNLPFGGWPSWWGSARTIDETSACPLELDIVCARSSWTLSRERGNAALSSSAESGAWRTCGAPRMTSTSSYTSGKSERWIPAVCRNFHSVKFKDIIIWKKDWKHNK